MMHQLGRWMAIFFCFAGVALADPADEPLRLVFLGDSLTAGYGIAPEQAYPALIEAQIAEQDWPIEIHNAGLSGETTAGGKRRLKWLQRRPIDILVVALGGNDGLRGIDTEASKGNLADLIDAARAHNPGIRIVLAGMQMPPNMGDTYTAAFRAMYPQLAKEKDVALIPFLLEDVGGVPEMNLPDGIHPNPEGHQRIAQEVWKTLQPVLREALGLEE